MKFERTLNVMLTERDLSLLKSLYDNVVMTFSQIEGVHFASTAKSTIINRLTKLEYAGFIRRIRIPKMELGNDKRAVGVVFQITKVGIQRLQQKFPLLKLKPEPISFSPFTLEHDLVLVDVANALKSRFGDCEIKNGKLGLTDGHTQMGLLPDLILSMSNTKEIFAIELELNGKSEKRYRELILRYRLNKVFTKVIYVVANPQIQGIISRVILNRTIHPNETPVTGKFYFGCLTDVLQNQSTAVFSNGQSKV